MLDVLIAGGIGALIGSELGSTHSVETRTVYREVQPKPPPKPSPELALRQAPRMLLMSSPCGHGKMFCSMCCWMRGFPQEVLFSDLSGVEVV